MKIQVIVLIVFIFLLVGCQSNIENSRPDDDPRDNVIDYELLESIHAIQEVLRNNASVPINNELINLSTKLSSDDQPAFYLDEERLRMLNEHYSLLESIVLDGYQSGTDFEAISYIGEDNLFFNKENLNSITVNLVKTYEGIQSYIHRELQYDSIQYVVDQLIGEFKDGKLVITRLQTSDEYFFFEEFVESKGMLTLVYEPMNSDKIEYNYIFFVEYDERTNIVIHYNENIFGIIFLGLSQHIYDEMNNLIYNVGTYDSLSYTLQHYAEVERIYEILINQETNLDDIDYSPIYQINSVVITLSMWPQILRAEYENIADYVVLEEKIIPFLNFDVIKNKIPEEQYADYLNMYNEYTELFSKNLMSYYDVLRVWEITNIFYMYLGLNQEDFTLITKPYPMIDLNRLEKEFIDEYGFSSSIYYYDYFNPENQLPSEIEYAIKFNHTYIETNIENIILEYGNHYNIQGRNLTPESFLSYLSSLGFILE